MLCYTKRKFDSLSLALQQKKCAELLRRAYDGLLANEAIEELLHNYNELQQWMSQPPLEQATPQCVADRYHWHLQQANIRHKEHNLLPQQRTQDRVEALAAPLPIAIYLDRIRSAHNVGSILRTTEAFGLGTLYFGPDVPFTDHKQVQDAAMGTDQWIRCYQNTPLNDLPRPIIALETSPEAINLHHFIFPENFTLVIGNEEYGCSDESLSQADIIVEIPLVGRKNSLNVANAYAIAAAEIVRQRATLRQCTP